MNSTSYASLCERIRTHCSQKEWYGPDGYYGSDVVYIHESVSEDGRLHVRSYSQWRGPGIDHDFRAGFFPPATEEQIRLSEEVMGFPYSPLLRTLYLQVANGGFGPAYGLVGAFCGFADTMRKKEPDEDLLQNSVVHPSYLWKGDFIELELYEEQNGDPKMIDLAPITQRFLPPEEVIFIDLGHYEKPNSAPKMIDSGPTVWSKYFIYLCEWGCGRSSYLHAHNGRVYYEDEDRLFHQADSLEEWLERWLQEEDLEQVSQMYFDD